MTRNVWVVDLAIAVVAAIVVLIVAPGYAISGLVAIIVLLVCGVSLLWDRRRQGGGPAPARRLRSRSPAPQGGKSGAPRSRL